MSVESQSHSVQESGEQVEMGESYGQKIWREYRSSWENLLGLFLMLFFFGIALIAPLLSLDYPFVWITAEEMTFPWFTWFFSAELTDKFYNQAFLSLVLTGFLSVWFVYAYRKGRWMGGKLLTIAVIAVVWGASVYFLGTADNLGVIGFPIPATGLYGLATLGGFLAWHMFDWETWHRSHFFWWFMAVFILFLGAGLLTFPNRFIDVNRGDIVQVDYPTRYDNAEPGEVTAYFPPNVQDRNQNLDNSRLSPLGKPLNTEVLNLMKAEKLKELILILARANASGMEDQLRDREAMTLREASEDASDLNGLRSEAWPIIRSMGGDREFLEDLDLSLSALAGRVEGLEEEPGREAIIDAIAEEEDVRTLLEGAEEERLASFADVLRDMNTLETNIRERLGVDPVPYATLIEPIQTNLGNPEVAMNMATNDPDVAGAAEQVETEYLGLSESEFKNTDVYQEYREQNPTRMQRHILGTDVSGRDLLSWSLFGARVSLSVGFVATSISLFIGIILGAIAGYFGGWIDLGISRLLEIVIMFPPLFLIIIILSMVDQKELFIFYIMLLIGILSWPGTCRLIRGTSLEAREEEYAMAARALGAGNLRVVFKHVLPNSIYPIFVTAPFAIAGGVIMEGALSMLGLGAQAYPSWGRMLQYARQNNAFHHDPYLIIVPIGFLFLAVLGYILIGFGLRDAVDPKMKAQ